MHEDPDLPESHVFLLTLRTSFPNSSDATRSILSNYINNVNGNFENIFDFFFYYKSLEFFLTDLRHVTSHLVYFKVQLNHSV